MKFCFSAAFALNPEAYGMYGTLYINPLLKIDLDPGHVLKPSKQKEGVNPLLPITPARPPRTIPVPVAPVSFSSHRIQGPQNRAAATILFTSRSHTNTADTACISSGMDATNFGVLFQQLLYKLHLSRAEG